MLERVEIIVPILEELENTGGKDGSWVIIPCIVGIALCPGIVIGMIMPRAFSIGFIAVVLCFVVFLWIRFEIEKRKFDQSYIEQARLNGISEEEAVELREYWNSSNSRMRKRIKKKLKRDFNAKNK